MATLEARRAVMSVTFPARMRHFGLASVRHASKNSIAHVGKIRDTYNQGFSCDAASNVLMGSMYVAVIALFRTLPYLCCHWMGQGQLSLLFCFVQDWMSQKRASSFCSHQERLCFCPLYCLVFFDRPKSDYTRCDLTSSLIFNVYVKFCHFL